MSPIHPLRLLSRGLLTFAARTTLHPTFTSGGLTLTELLIACRMKSSLHSLLTHIFLTDHPVSRVAGALDFNFLTML